MLTIEEIKNISFRKATLSAGYRAEDVDAFIDEVIATFEQQKKEKTNLVHKIDRLATRLEQYKEDEETVRNALLTSQKMSDACIKEAKEKAAKILKDAEEQAEAIVSDAERKVVVEKQTYLELHSDAVDLRNELIELYSRHIQSIDDFPTASDVEKSRDMLNEKYPDFPVELPGKEAPAQPEPQEEEASAPAQPEPEEEEEAPAPAPEEEEPAEEEEAPAPAAPETAKRVSIKRPAKFKHLKFGDNYDVSDE